MDFEEVHDWVLGIDPGWRNMGLAIYDRKTMQEVKTWTEDLLGKKKMQQVKSAKDRVSLINAWYNKNYEWFQHCNLVVIEDQLTEPLTQLAWYIAGMFHGKSYLVSPLSVKKYFRLAPTGNHGQNKKLAMNFTKKTNHNIADACLLAKYAIQNKLKLN